MKKLIFPALAAIMFTACNDNAQSTPQNEDSIRLVERQNALKDSTNFTTVVWVDSTTKNMGDVKKGQTIEIPFVIKNTGDKPLIIASVEPGCGCTVADKPEKPIMPGKEEKIVAKFNSENQGVGPHNKNIVVRANTKPVTDHILNFNVNVTE